MTDSNAAWEKWLEIRTVEGNSVKEFLDSRDAGDNLGLWLRAAFDAGVKAAEAKPDKPKWPESAVEADMKRMKELGVLWP